jgi:hypothetical protein
MWGEWYIQVLGPFIVDALLLAAGFNSGILVVAVDFNSGVLVVAVGFDSGVLSLVVGFNNPVLILAVGLNSRLLVVVCFGIVASELAAALVQLLRALVLATHFDCDLWCAWAKMGDVLIACGERERLFA